MCKRLISLILIIMFSLPVLNISADENVLTNYTIMCDNSEQEQLIKLTDGDENTCVVFTPLLNTELKLEFDSVVSVSGIDIALKTFPAWRNIRQLTIGYGGRKTKVIDVNQGKIETYHVTDDTLVAGINNISVRVTKIDIDTNQYINDVSGGISEIIVYGTSGDELEITGTPVEFEYGKEMLLTTSSGISPGTEWYINNAFDGNYGTVTSINDVVSGYLVFNFEYPTDITQLAIHPVLNSSWAVIKNFKLGVYNEENVYRAKLKNPDPLFSDKVYTLKKTDKMQYFNINDELLKGVTHLMIKFEGAYVINNPWGGIREMEIYGVEHNEKRPTAEIIWRALPTNTQIMCASGLIDGEPDAIKYNKPTRMDGLNFILKMWGEYDKACAYNGKYNFKDASLYPEYENILSYVYAYEKFGIDGDSDGNFNPGSPLDARAFYKMLLSALGYEYKKDYTWEDMDNLLRNLYMGSMISVADEEFTVANMCTAAYEALTAPDKNGGSAMIVKMYKEGRIAEEGYTLYADKDDRSFEYQDDEYIIPENADRNSDFTFTLNEDAKHLSALSFAYNTPFHYAGIYYGTLPADNPLSKRPEYAEALNEAGVKAMRFPGGMPAHQYFIEGEEYSKQFYKDCYSHLLNPWSGLYDPNTEFKGWYVGFYDWLDFCNETGIEPIFQTNTGFFVDENGKLRQAYLGAVMDTADGKFEPMPGYYDHNRIDEAAQALARNIDDLLEKGYMIKYWEIGNEDFCWNYSSKPLSDPTNPYTIDFMEAVEAYVRVIKERIPDAYIMLPHGFDYKNTLDPEVYKMIGSVGYHYPFGQWSQPPEDQKANPNYLVGMNEMAIGSKNFPKAKRAEKKAAGEVASSVTETTLSRFQGWDAGHLNNMFAQALNVAHNFGDMAFNSGFDDAFVIHDLESTFFGYVIYDATMNPDSRNVTWNLFKSGFTVADEDIPDAYRFDDKYYINPAGRAVGIMSRHINGDVLDPDKLFVERKVSAFSSVNRDKISLTVVNRLDEEKTVTVKYPQYQIDEQTVTATVMHSDWLRASLENEYELYEEEISVGNNNVVEFNIKPYSIMHLEIKINK